MSVCLSVTDFIFMLYFVYDFNNKLIMSMIAYKRRLNKYVSK